MRAAQENKLAAIHEFIVQYSMERGRKPLLKEIAHGVGLASPSGVHYYVKSLQRKKESS